MTKRLMYGYNCSVNQSIKTKGGVRPGAGRPVAGTTERIDVRVTPAEKTAFNQWGGNKALRAFLASLGITRAP